MLTEEDYLDFLCNAAETSQQHSDCLRLDVRTALAGSSLLFIDYRLYDWTFRVLFWGLMQNIRANLGRPSVAILPEPTKDEVAGDMLPQAQDYLQKYIGRLLQVDSVNVYWGDPFEFAKELAARWNGPAVVTPDGIVPSGNPSPSVQYFSGVRRRSSAILRP